MEPIHLYLLVAALMCAGLSGSVADEKGFSIATWTTAGFLFGPLALIAIAGMPDKQQRKYLRHLAEKQGWENNNQGAKTVKTHESGGNW